jgi:hypothetical protein
MSHQGWRRSTLAGGAASCASTAPAAIASDGAQSVSVLREATTLQMRSEYGLAEDDLPRTFLDLAIMNSPVDARKQAKKSREADQNLRNDFQTNASIFALQGK